MEKEKIKLFGENEIEFRGARYESVEGLTCDECDLKDFCNLIDWYVETGEYISCFNEVWKKKVSVWKKKGSKKNIFQTIRAYKSKDDLIANNPLDLRFIVNQNEDYADRYEKEYARGVAWGLTVKYASPCVVVLTTIDGKTKVTEVHHVRRPVV